MSLKSIWVAGDWREPVFDEAVAWLRSNADCQFFDSPAATGANLSDGRFPQAFVLVQSRPGQFSTDEVEMLHGREPLARLIALTGPWCEGELRSGRPIPGVARVAWRNWRERLPVELAIHGQNLLAPRTATETDRAERIVHVTDESHAGRDLALVFSTRLETFNQIADGIQKFGFEVVPFGTSTHSSMTPDVIIFDGWEQATAFKEQSTDKNCLRHSLRVLLLHFPRPEDHILAREAGIDAVIGLPLTLADLKSALANTMAPAA
jgi:hypothetical protein